MNIALTADLHLTSRKDHPERYETLEEIFSAMLEEGLRTLVIAGDLFDRERANHNDFDRLCNDVHDMGLEIWVLCGNHDMHLKQRMFSAANVHVVTEPQLITIDRDAPPLMMLPYAEQNMGEALEAHASAFPEGPWILIAHGDYIPVMRDPHPLEPGVYMPLTAKDLQEYHPRRTFLGHIHKPFDGSDLHYMGSPCSLDPTETGRRRFLIYDLDDDKVEPRWLHSGPLRFLVEILCVPGEQELEWLEEEMDRIIEGWALEPGDEGRVQVRATVRGVASDRQAVIRTVEDRFRAYVLDGDVDVSDLSSTNDPDRSRIVERVKARLEELEWDVQNENEPTRNDILVAALKTIYGV